MAPCSLAKYRATNNSGGATTNLGTVNSTTSGTQTITWDKDALAVGTHTVRLRRTSYTGTQVAIDSSVVPVLEQFFLKFKKSLFFS